MNTKHEKELLKKKAKSKTKRQVYTNDDKNANIMITHSKENEMDAAKATCF